MRSNVEGVGCGAVDVLVVVLADCAAAVMAKAAEDRSVVRFMVLGTDNGVACK